MTRQPLETVAIRGEVTRTTSAAVMIRHTDSDRDVWVPRSILLDGDALDIGDIDIVCPTWFARREGLT